MNFFQCKISGCWVACWQKWEWFKIDLYNAELFCQYAKHNCFQHTAFEYKALCFTMLCRQIAFLISVFAEQILNNTELHYMHFIWYHWETANSSVALDLPLFSWWFLLIDGLIITSICYGLVCSLDTNYGLSHICLIQNLLVMCFIMWQQIR